MISLVIPYVGFLLGYGGMYAIRKARYWIHAIITTNGKDAVVQQVKERYP
jgi:hypothetical protein